MSLTTVSLEDKYTRDSGRVFMTGTQALVRLPMLQREWDRAQGLNTAGFISGYRGSPLGGYDQALWRARDFLKRGHIHFEPGVNEDLAATALWGSQQVALFQGARYDGVFGFWYGKGPGVDRSIDVLRHANFAGTSRHGGVLALAGDDHAAVSSTTAHQSELNFLSVGMPVLHPATIEEYLEFGLIGMAMSRFAGVWVGFKCITETTESSASISLDSLPRTIITPEDVEFPPDGVHIRWPDTMLAQERRLTEFKLPAALAFALANRLDRKIISADRKRLGIVSTGKSYIDVLQALEDLGISKAEARDAGLSIYKVGMVWPLEPEGLRAFALGHEELLVVEEKRPLIEQQIRDQLYTLPDSQRPRILGKRDADGVPLLSSDGELRPAAIARAIAARLAPFYRTERMAQHLALIASQEQEAARHIVLAERRPYFCSGCPHNRSTKVPEGSRALAGIGCHFLALGMERDTATFSQMGGEGVAWIGQAPFTDEQHVFANIGDGTYFHSGLLAIRAAVAAKVNITYKLLFNDAVAMTGGQPVEGALTVPAITQQLSGEGVRRIVVVADDPGKYPDGSTFATGVAIRPREDLELVQKELRAVTGCTVIIYDQTCAAEKRRRRSRGKLPDPDQRLFINDAVCEGCGDCSHQSNCVSIEPLETEFGRKRTINQSSCNKDYSCVEGFCPSFVTVTGARIRGAKGGSAQPPHATAMADELPLPVGPDLSEPCGILVTGVGGTGVITIGALLSMAAHIEGRGVTVLDQTGLAQKNGAVMSHVRIAASPEALHAVRIGVGGARVVLACDMITADGKAALETMRAGTTCAVVNAHLSPTADFTLRPDFRVDEAAVVSRIASTCGEDRAEFFDATALATALSGDAIATNMFMLGHAFQRGLLPVSLAALMQAIELNGAAVEANKTAFSWGRLHAAKPDFVRRAAFPTPSPQATTEDEMSLEALVAHRSRHLEKWQNLAWATRYANLVAQAQFAESRSGAVQDGYARVVARVAAKLMSYKDEYEVARLYTDYAFLEKLGAQFDGDYKIAFNLAPPLLARRNKGTGEPMKIRFGSWLLPAFKILASFKKLRGTPFDLFGYTAERRSERQLVTDYFSLIDEINSKLTPGNYRLAVSLAFAAGEIRGFGHIKERSITAAKAKETDLLQQFRIAKPQAEAAE